MAQICYKISQKHLESPCLPQGTLISKWESLNYFSLYPNHSQKLMGSKLDQEYSNHFSPGGIFSRMHLFQEAFSWILLTQPTSLSLNTIWLSKIDL